MMTTGARVLCKPLKPLLLEKSNLFCHDFVQSLLPRATGPALQHKGPAGEAKELRIDIGTHRTKSANQDEASQINRLLFGSRKERSNIKPLASEGKEAHRFDANLSDRHRTT